MREKFPNLQIKNFNKANFETLSSSVFLKFSWVLKTLVLGIQNVYSRKFA